MSLYDLDDKERAELKRTPCPRHVEVTHRGELGRGVDVRCHHCGAHAYDLRGETAEMLHLELCAVYKRHRGCPAPARGHVDCPCTADAPSAPAVEQLSFLAPEPAKPRARAPRRARAT